MRGIKFNVFYINSRHTERSRKRDYYIMYYIIQVCSIEKLVHYVGLAVTRSYWLSSYPLDVHTNTLPSTTHLSDSTGCRLMDLLTLFK